MKIHYENNISPITHSAREIKRRNMYEIGIYPPQFIHIKRTLYTIRIIFPRANASTQRLRKDFGMSGGSSREMICVCYCVFCCCWWWLLFFPPSVGDTRDRAIRNFLISAVWQNGWLCMSHAKTKRQKETIVGICDIKRVNTHYMRTQHTV